MVFSDRNWNKSITAVCRVKRSPSSSLRAIIHASFTCDSQSGNKRSLFTLPETIIWSARAFRAGPDVNIVYRTKRGYAINTRARQYISFALLHAQSTCCRRHLSRSPLLHRVKHLRGFLLRLERQRGRKPHSRIAKNPSHLTRRSVQRRGAEPFDIPTSELCIHERRRPFSSTRMHFPRPKKARTNFERLIDWCYTVFDCDTPFIHWMERYF